MHIYMYIPSHSLLCSIVHSFLCWKFLPTCLQPLILDRVLIFDYFVLDFCCSFHVLLVPFDVYSNSSPSLSPNQSFQHVYPLWIACPSSFLSKSINGRLNSGVEIASHCVRLSSGNALSLLKDYDIVMDCSGVCVFRMHSRWSVVFLMHVCVSVCTYFAYEHADNAPTRYLLSDTCVMLNKTLVSGSALRGHGQVGYC